MGHPFNPPLSEGEIAPVFPGLEILKAIKAGGQGATFLCRQKTDGHQVALKIYGSETEPERVRREIQKLRTVDSPYVMKIEGDGEVVLRGEVSPFALAEWIEGADLRVHLSGKGPGAAPMDESEILQLLGQGARAIEALSAQSVVHRDINPNNIMRRPDGRFVLIDLGFAKHLDMQTITELGTTFGTRGYISPELYINRFRPTFRSDLFSLGVVGYEMAAGIHPFGYDQRRVAQIQFTPVARLSDQVNQLLRRLMSAQPLDRAGSCEDIYLACEC